jgi:hypothetical protein
MKTKEELLEKAKRMQAYLEEKPGTEPNEIIEKIENLSILISQSGDLLSQAKYIQDSVISSEIMNALKEGYQDKLTATGLNKLINSLAKEENYLVNLFDRINAAATHQLDGCRSILSYRKTEFSALNYSSK